jgi:uncharacterized protein
MRYYVADEEDPIIRAWQLVFPDLFTPLSEASLSLQEHFRYPEDLFQAQAHQYANYHVTDPAQFYQKEDFWEIPLIPEDPVLPGSQQAELEPYYVLLTPPGADREQFLLFTPFTPAQRPNMVAWMAANSDPEGYGELTSFQFQAQNVNGPGQVSALINQETELAQEISLLSQRGSQVIYGDILAIPIGPSFLYVQPLYVQASGQGIPELKRVVVVNGEQVAVGANLAEALSVAFGEAAPEEPVGPTEPTEPTEPDQDLASLLAEAQEHFDAAQEALQAGDLGTYQTEIEAARALIQQAAALAGATPTPTPSPTGGGGGGG